MKEDTMKNIMVIMSAFALGIIVGIMLSASVANARTFSTDTVIESRIDGDFEGWEGETVVKLMNGQIWIQTEYYYTYHYAFMPEVLIYKSGGGYKMKVDGVDKAVGVERIK